MDNNDKIELGMLTAALASAVAYRDQDPEELKAVAKALLDWAHADADERRSIYHAWRNS